VGKRRGASHAGLSLRESRTWVVFFDLKTLYS
jgi:hypothetical protein